MVYYSPHSLVFVPAIAEVYKSEGNDAYGKKDLVNAIHFYTEGIKVKCKDEELNSKLYSNRAIAHFYCGKVLSMHSKTFENYFMEKKALTVSPSFILPVVIIF